MQWDMLWASLISRLLKHDTRGKISRLLKHDTRGGVSRLLKHIARVKV
jgi:hypothetical protein